MNDKEALDKIAKAVALDEDGMWTDQDGILESIGNIVQSTGRTVEGWE
ncbi:hypothetical protein [Prescottella agglutinans]|uniref:Uncharacterized protein n=1 Tax=Prescottella agglutinans TaxID=1644129 RepID=A0ABT6MGI2_9NOCA|nr:hypothetical protein [Prescottella agglutinans]MDH6282906.1 hypothetical protein [Prescottella agglutinans]